MENLEIIETSPTGYIKYRVKPVGHSVFSHFDTKQLERKIVLVPYLKNIETAEIFVGYSEHYECYYIEVAQHLAKDDISFFTFPSDLPIRYDPNI